MTPRRRCKRCGHDTGAELYTKRPMSNRPEVVCRNRAACAQRLADAGVWMPVDGHTGRWWERRDTDGTRWLIHPRAGHPGDVVLIMFAAGIRLSSVHESQPVAEAHAADMTRAMAARSLRDYPEGEVSNPVDLDVTNNDDAQLGMFP